MVKTTEKPVSKLEDTGLALLTQIETALAHQQRVLSDWEKKRKPAIQCEDALNEFVKEIAAFKKSWYEANFLSHYYMKIMLNALKVLTSNPAAHLALSARSIKLDKILEDFVLETAEKAQAEDDEKLDNGKKYKPGKQMTLFDEMADRGVTTILSFNVPTDELPDLVVEKIEETQGSGSKHDDPEYVISWVTTGIMIVAENNVHRWSWDELKKGIPKTWCVQDEKLGSFWGWILKQENSPARKANIPIEHHEGAVNLLKKVKKAKS